MTDTLLTIQGLNSWYGPSQVLWDIDLQVRKGAVTALLGSNGAGKTTLLRSICNMVKRQGQLRWEGKDISRLGTQSIVKLGISQVPEGRGTFMELDVRENLLLGAYLRNDRTEVAADIDFMLTVFPRLAERLTQQAGTLSGGEQQMLAIARALMLRPRLLLLDEPSFGLAPLVVREIFNILGRIREERALSMLIVEQNSTMALELADYGYVLASGRMVTSGTGDELRRSDALRRAYLGY